MIAAVSPVSRGRKTAKSTKKKAGRSRRASGRASDRPVQDRGAVTAGDPGGSFGRNAGGGLSGVHHSGHAGDNPWDLLLAPRERPEWFDVASGAVLAGADAVLAAGGPRELEQATVDLVGAQLRVVVRDDGLGLWFDWWFEELVGVLAVGAWSLADKAAFPDATVWSGFGSGYGYVPLVLPMIGLWWLLRGSRTPSTRS